MDKRLEAFERLLHIMDDLREKCPWDKKQTVQSLRKLTIEETYELSDAIIKEDWKSIKEELGDLFLHLVFYAKIGTEQEQFNLETVLNGVCEKLIFRHPHIYGDPETGQLVNVENEDDVKKNWEKLKLKEGKKSVLEGVPNSLPAINKAQRIQDKVRAVGFDWDNKDQVMDKIMEEIGELKEAIEQQDEKSTELEFGDVLFAMINYSRFIKVDAEQALEKTNQKFMKRFKWMENYATQQQLDMHSMNLEQLDEIWNIAKVEINKEN
ncbi:MAG TPA: nucleoside triphosphate pyrophosphohydrolase [Chitinophagales bacterium]|jgi:MazG family protein|nr:nucleoside triphosphate pyrophosphohydrolase [Chitinophagales bacterium]HPH87428.1 nucleoside triphosphate pyrophosphohydrolase [Chitinophagales bacterium]HPN18406.1 nucleoside triphosphate pyrophosphohydrolase [Chitinophagales bacterium]